MCSLIMPFDADSRDSRIGARMPRKKKRSIGPLEPGRAAFLAKRVRDVAAKQPALRTLRRKLLSLGGLALVAPPACDPDLDAILAHGVAFDGSKAKRVRGRDSDCHGNVSRLWRNDPDSLQIVTGYALSDDGLWRSHTWAFEGARVIETTEARLLYFGVALAVEHATRFAKANT